MEHLQYSQDSYTIVGGCNTFGCRSVLFNANFGTNGGVKALKVLNGNIMFVVDEDGCWNVLCSEETGTVQKKQK
jgi:hypothetical protein